MNNIDEMLHRMRYDELHDWADWDAAADLIESQQHRGTVLETRILKSRILRTIRRRRHEALQAERDALRKKLDAVREYVNRSEHRDDWNVLCVYTDELRAILDAAEQED